MPSEVKVGADFLARLWIRRPATKPLNEVQLRRELGLKPDTPVDMRAASVEIELRISAAEIGLDVRVDGLALADGEPASLRGDEGLR